MDIARPLRIEMPDGWYHVTSRGNERRVIFRTETDRYPFWYGDWSRNPELLT